MAKRKTKNKKAVGYYRVAPGTKAFIAKEAKRQGFKIVGNYVDYLISMVKKAKRSKKDLRIT